MTRFALNAAWARAIADYRQLVRDGLVREALPQYDDRRREEYLSDVERRAAELAGKQHAYDDAKRRFVHYDRLGTVRLPQPQSGRAWQQRQRAISDAPWFREDLNTARLESIDNGIKQLLRLLDKGEQ